MIKIFLFIISEDFLFNFYVFRMKVILFICIEGFDELISICRCVGFYDFGIFLYFFDIICNKKKKNNMILRKNLCFLL